MTESGLTALVRLSSGDMRKALNILQVNLTGVFYIYFSLASTIVLILVG